MLFVFCRGKGTGGDEEVEATTGGVEEEEMAVRGKALEGLVW